MHRLSVAVSTAVVMLFGIVLTLGLFGSTPTGAGDNGDGVRLYCGAGLLPDTPTKGSNWLGGVVVDFDRGEACPQPQPSSALPALRLAAAGEDPFSLTRLGWVYAIAVALVTGVAVWAVTKRGLAWALVLLPAAVPLLNVDFTRFFVSTFTEPPGLVGAYALLCGLAVAVVTDPGNRVERAVALVLVGAGGLVAGTAKPSFAPVLAVAVLVCAVVRFGARGWKSRIAGPVVAVAAAVAAVGPLTATLQWQDSSYTGVNTFNLVYTVVLEEIPGATAELGITPEAQSYAGNAYFPNGPGGVPGADELIPKSSEYRTQAWKVLAAHPGAALTALSVGVVATESRDLAYLPSRTWSPGVEREPLPPTVTGSQGADRESLRAWLSSVVLPWKPWAVAVLGLLAGVFALFRRANRALTVLCRTAGAAALTGLGVVALAILGDGYFEVAKHVWLAAYLFDVTLLALVGAAVVAVVTAVRRRSASDTPDESDAVEAPGAEPVPAGGGNGRPANGVA
ncbi:hypothetical protein L6E12_22085 [Actinokineospora sp. PR83]|uniref:glycan biosynthesis hexose transferase WsfD n=1 Tax=Actinokineospora sp. PR83 TaxID=2884908 RepID=UPI001F1FE5BB|nr:hypothetical protein [Actinokineospora sp. PR83]MCG8918477.1 hypothetical protein [Actinokineospora sp. PR83]